jgi:hypothetical protein
MNDDQGGGVMTSHARKVGERKVLMALAVLVWGVAVSGSCQAQPSRRSAPRSEASPPAVVATGGPRLAIVETVFDFGEVAEGAVVSHDFVIKNTGTAVLDIQEVRPG